MWKIASLWPTDMELLRRLGLALRPPSVIDLPKRMNHMNHDKPRSHPEKWPGENFTKLLLKRTNSTSLFFPRLFHNFPSFPFEFNLPKSPLRGHTEIVQRPHRWFSPCRCRHRGSEASNRRNGTQRISSDDWIWFQGLDSSWHPCRISWILGGSFCFISFMWEFNSCGLEDEDRK